MSYGDLASELTCTVGVQYRPDPKDFVFGKECVKFHNFLILTVCWHNILDILDYLN